MGIKRISLIMGLFIISSIGFKMVHADQDIDRRIESSFKDSLVYTNYLSGKNDSVKIESVNGVVTLSGKVSSDVDKTLAESTAENIPNVVSVNNKLDVIGDQSRGNSDSWISTKIKGTLMFHRNVSAFKTDVTTKNGIVTLRGETDNQAQKELIASYAQDIEGVKKVNNEMVVTNKNTSSQNPGLVKTVDDASITAQVKTALLFHRSTSVLRTSVSTKSGVVTVEGQAKNGAEKDLVTQLVSDINGVREVVNNMTVDETTHG